VYSTWSGATGTVVSINFRDNPKLVQVLWDGNDTVGVFGCFADGLLTIESKEQHE
jgi:hypothetical protein